MRSVGLRQELGGLIKLPPQGGRKTGEGEKAFAKGRVCNEHDSRAMGGDNPGGIVGNRKELFWKS